MDFRPAVIVRLLLSRGRIDERFAIGRLRKRGMTRISSAPTTQSAGVGVVREHLRSTVGAWDPNGDMGRAELADLIRRAQR